MGARDAFVNLIWPTLVPSFRPLHGEKPLRFDLLAAVPAGVEPYAALLAARLGCSAGRDYRERAIRMRVPVLRQATLGGDAKARARLMELVPLHLFMQVEEGLRQTFFEDAIAIMERDQYVDVNVITPAMTRVQGALPPEVRASYVRALISQSKSGAWKGAPAALAALTALPDELMNSAFQVLDGKTLYWESQNRAVKQFLKEHRSSWPAERQTLYEDFLNLNPWDFGAKHVVEDP